MESPFGNFFKEEHKVMPKVSINIGAGLDIPTGSLITGLKGETIINGGLANTVGMVGTGNNYKSTILHYMQLKGMDRMMEGCTKNIGMATYDTECNISIDRLESLASRMKYVGQNPITQTGKWMVMDKSKILGDEWTDIMFKFMETKGKDEKNKVEYECFKDPYSDKPMRVPFPSFAEIDSLTEFEAASTVNLLKDGLDGSDTNTYAMKQGGFKTKVVTQLPRLVNSSNTYLGLTAQAGGKINIPTGPMSAQPTKKLQYMKHDMDIKGATGKFNFLLLNAWWANTASKLTNQTTRQAEYPIDNSQDSIETELNVVRLTLLRGKFGPSGINLEIVVSQYEGVLPTLTEFHNIKENGKYGISGSNISYFMDIYPDVSLSRTTVRRKIDSDAKLRRAINITLEMMQLSLYMGSHPDVMELMCSPKELYEDIKKLGYDWNILLKTREYWTINQYSNPIPFLSSMDLLKMRKGLYHPYFLNEDKTVKKEYLKITE